MWAERLHSIQGLERRFRREPPEHWLAPGERQRLAEIRSARRGLQWLGGRWLAKQLLLRLADESGMSPTDLHIESKDARGRGSRPRVYRDGRLQSWQLSISHSSRFVYAAVATDSCVQLGVDVTKRQPLSPGFTRLWLTASERKWCGRNGDAAACVLWSLKESWYKAAGSDQPFAPRRLDVVSALSLNEISMLEPAVRRRWRLRNDLGGTILCRWMPRDVATLVLLRGGARSAAPINRLLAEEFSS